MRCYCRYLVVLLVWMVAHESVFGDTINSDITTTITAQPSTNVKVGLLQRLGSYMLSTMDQIILPMRPFYQGMTRVIRSLHPVEFQMYKITLSAVNHTTAAPTPAPIKNPTIVPTSSPTMSPTLPGQTMSPTLPVPSYSPTLAPSAPSYVPTFAPTLRPQVNKDSNKYLFAYIVATVSELIMQV